jgi:hypothetical protein
MTNFDANSVQLVRKHLANKTKTVLHELGFLRARGAPLSLH